jgi:uncharacterized LabA/DUF88 family protein
MNERVAIFIDFQNLHYLIDFKTTNLRLDYQKFITKITGDRQLFRAYLYMALMDESENDELSAEKQRKFIFALNRIPNLQVVEGVLKSRGDSYKEKGVDIALALDAITLCKHYDTIALVSGDGDFEKLLRMLQERGKHTEVYSSGTQLAPELVRYADLVVDLNEAFIKDCQRDL